MDGENNGKTLLKWDDLRGEKTYFWKHPFLSRSKNPPMKLAEPRIKPEVTSWWLSRDPSNGLLQSPYNWVVCHIYNEQAGASFFIAQLNLSGETSQTE